MEENKEVKNEGEENRKKDSSPLVGLDEICVLPETLDFYIFNKDKNKLKNIVTEEVKLFENEVRLIDVLTGVVECGIDKKIIDDLRQYFKISKQIGYNPQKPYDFRDKQDKHVYNLSLFLKIQKVAKNSSEYNEF